MIKEITIEDFCAEVAYASGGDEPPFYGKGGRVKVVEIFGEHISEILNKLNHILVG